MQYSPNKQPEEHPQSRLQTADTSILGGLRTSTPPSSAAKGNKNTNPFAPFHSNTHLPDNNFYRQIEGKDKAKKMSKPGPPPPAATNPPPGRTMNMPNPYSWAMKINKKKTPLNAAAGARYPKRLFLPDHIVRFSSKECAAVFFKAVEEAVLIHFALDDPSVPKTKRLSQLLKILAQLGIDQQVIIPKPIGLTTGRSKWNTTNATAAQFYVVESIPLKQRTTLVKRGYTCTDLGTIFIDRLPLHITNLISTQGNHCGTHRIHQQDSHQGSLHCHNYLSGSTMYSEQELDAAKTSTERFANEVVVIGKGTEVNTAVFTVQFTKNPPLMSPEEHYKWLTAI
ncbi:hypothetical protein EST38_g4663 [Candolleomyces aberdarensis]|uniref:Uncharacterized protein n=1 Tax=Candolleomyces aberdarensis TaxID=2316362 RepID=A0A4Q2DQC2_9AGAR|nr:hypothetical protein EST38_g4663 [Candolleomyces aberdarensis]